MNITTNLWMIEIDQITKNPRKTKIKKEIIKKYKFSSYSDWRIDSLNIAFFDKDFPRRMCVNMSVYVFKKLRENRHFFTPIIIFQYLALPHNCLTSFSVISSHLLSFSI